MIHVPPKAAAAAAAASAHVSLPLLGEEYHIRRAGHSNLTRKDDGK